MKPLLKTGLFAASLTFLSGCVIESAERSFENGGEDTFAPLAHEDYISLEEAIAYTDSDLLEQFWFRAYVANNIEKRRITHMTNNGIVDRENESYYAVNSFVTRPYDYFRDPDHVFLRRAGNWFDGREPVVPYDIFYGFEEWGDALDDAEVVGMGEVLSIPTFVHELTLSGEELFGLGADTLQELSGPEADRLAPILDNTDVTVHFYVGDETQSTDETEILPVIYKYEIFIDMPVPGAGFMEQEMQYFLFRVNDPGIDMVEADEIAPFVIEIDRVREDMEEQFEQEQELLEEMEEEEDSEDD